MAARQLAGLFVVVLSVTTALGQDSGFGCSPSTLAKIAFGVGSSAAQTEGAAAVGGRAPSVWDKFAALPGKISDGSTPAVATDFYNKYKQDIALMKSLGVKNFRMSISWSRLLPGGVKGSRVNEEAVRWYNAVFDELKRAGIEPAVTLYHWDLPQVLQDRYEGMLSRQFVDDFVYYADVAFARFGPRVRKWTTFNEAWVVCNNQYGNGDFAPGVAYGDAGKWKCGHNLLLAHAYAVKLFRDKYKKAHDGRIGMALWSEWSEPYTSDPLDLKATQNKLDTDFGWFADTIHFGDYPEHIKRTQAQFLPVFSNEERSLLKKSYDYMGLTIYTGKWASMPADNPDGWWVRTRDANGNPPGEQAESYWLYNVPWSIGRMLRYMAKRYDNPFIWVLENGISEKGEAGRSGEAALADRLRTDYFRGYIGEACTAVDEGVRMTNFFTWSFTDNWEWREGFQTRFGLVRIDFGSPSLPRRVKASARWLAENVFRRSSRQ